LERLDCSLSAEYSNVEAAIHISRYAVASGLCAGRRVLDVACGGGYGAWLLKQAGAASVTGVDIAREAIDQAKLLYVADGLTFQVCDAAGLAEQFEPGSFDMVVSIETLEHLDAPAKFLQAVKRVTTEDATIVVTCPNDHAYYQDHQRNPFHYTKYTFEQFRSLTTAQLGSNVEWFLGMAALGFTTVAKTPADRARASRSKWTDVMPLQRAYIVSPDPGDVVSTETCSYFVGIWNAPTRAITGAAVSPVSLQSFFHSLSKSSEFQELERLRSVDAERRLTQVQAIALRKENEIIASQLGALRAEERRLREEQRRLVEELAADAERKKRWETLSQLETQRDELASEKASLQDTACQLQAENASLRQSVSHLEQEIAVWRKIKTRLRAVVPEGSARRYLGRLARRAFK
jgi:SAM-dependent methyltransferase